MLWPDLASAVRPSTFVSLGPWLVKWRQDEKSRLVVAMTPEMRLNVLADNKVGIHLRAVPVSRLCNSSSRASLFFVQHTHPYRHISKQNGFLQVRQQGHSALHAFRLARWARAEGVCPRLLRCLLRDWGYDIYPFCFVRMLCVPSRDLRVHISALSPSYVRALCMREKHGRQCSVWCCWGCL